MTLGTDTLAVLKQCVLLMSDIFAMPIHELLGAFLTENVELNGRQEKYFIICVRMG